MNKVKGRATGLFFCFGMALCVNYKMNFLKRKFKSLLFAFFLLFYSGICAQSTLYFKLRKNVGLAKPQALNYLKQKYELPQLPELLQWVGKSLPDVYEINQNADDSLLIRLKSDSLIEWVDFNYSLKVFNSRTLPEDSLLQNQWYWFTVGGEWIHNYVAEKDSIIVAVIDTGIDWHHPDLKNSLWINKQEDLDGDGYLSGSDMNGIDDDGNGIVDDVLGYDFTDSPELPAAGDYLIPDPFPEDEYGDLGHGTPVAGIIAAESGNQHGISGLSSSRIMVLKAGNSSGYLQADDVIRAIFYAVHNGAHIINMSFGDTYNSPFLHEALQYADAQGVILVAAAGNNGSDTPIYPAAWDEVIGVSSINPTRTLSAFSSFGNWVSVCAPGENMLTTAVESAYGRVQGTSFAAPVISALIADLLMLEKVDNPSNTLIQQSYLSQSLDLGLPGKDEWYGYGMAQLPLLSGPVNQNYNIIFPTRNSNIYEDTIFVTGNCWGESFEKYRLTIYQNGQLIDSSPWNMGAVVNDTLDMISLTNVLPGIPAELRLQVSTVSGDVENESITFFKHSQIPEIKEISIFEKMIAAQTQTVLKVQLEFPERAKVVLKDGQSHILSEKIKGPDQIHYFNLYEPDMKVAEIFIGTDSLYTMPDTILNYTPTYNSLALYPAISSDYYTSGGQLLPRVLDVNHNGYPEFLFSQMSGDTIFGQLKLVEYSPSLPEPFLELSGTEKPLIPVDVSDINRDGKDDILCGYGDKAYILSDLNGDGIPMEIAWEDTVGGWPVGFIKDPYTAETYLVLRKNNVYTFYSQENNYTFIERMRLDPQDNNPVYSRPVIYQAKMENKNYIFFGDYYGNVYFFNFSGPGMVNYAFKFETDITRIADYMFVSDFNNDGDDEIYVMYNVLDNSGSDESVNNSFTELDKLLIAGNSVSILPLYYFASLGLGNTFFHGINRIGEYLVLSVSPEQYWLKFEQDNFKPVFTQTGMNSNFVLSFSIGSNNYSMAHSFNGMKVDLKSGLDVSNFITGFNFSQLSDSIVVSKWNLQNSGEDSIRVSLSLSDSTLIDSLLKGNGELIYSGRFEQGTTMRSSAQLFQSGVSVQTISDSIIISREPELNILIVQSNPLHIQVLSDTPLQNKYLKTENFRLGKTATNPSYVLSTLDGKEINLFFEFGLSQSDTLQVTSLKTVTGFLFSRKIPVIPIMEEVSDFYPTRVEFVDRENLTIYFNDKIDASQDFASDKVEIIPPVAVENIAVQSDDPTRLKLHLNRQNKVGGFGFRGVVKIKDILSENGEISGNGAAISLPVLYTVKSLSNVLLFPNPLTLNTSEELTFAQIPAFTEIRIFSLNGELLFYKQVKDNSGFFTMNLNNELPEIPSGVYIIGLWHGNEKKMMKLFYIK